MFLSLFIIAVIVAADRLVKFWAASALQPVGEMAGIKGIFHFTYVENTGAAFSILENQKWILIAVAAVLVIIALYILIFKKLKLSYNICLVFIAAGGMGNLIDRILYGYVVDMFQFDFVRFAIFNVADIFITVGGILLIIVYLFFDKEKQFEKNIKLGKKKNENAETDSK